MTNLANISPDDKICIIVYGNIASGKTTLCNKIVQLLPQFSIVSIDESRKKFFGIIANGELRERMAGEEMIRQLFSTQFVVYETTGASRLFNSIHLRLLEHFKTVFIQVKCPVSVCRFRHDTRYNDISAMPAFNSKMDIDRVMLSIENNMISWPNLLLDSEKLNAAEMFESFKAKFLA